MARHIARDELDQAPAIALLLVADIQERHDRAHPHDKPSLGQELWETPREVAVGKVIIPRLEDAAHALIVVRAPHD